MIRNWLIGGMAVAVLVGGFLLWRERQLAQHEPYCALPAVLPHRTDAAKVGMYLFQSRLLVGGPRTCGSCHSLDNGGTDGKVYDGRRTPSIFCAGITCPELEVAVARMLKYAAGPLTNNQVQVAELPATRIHRDPVLSRRLKKTYGEHFAEREIVDALAHYLRTLVPIRTAFDRYLSGHGDALGKEDEKGFKVFEREHCGRCHGGVALGGKWVDKVSKDRLPPALRGLRFRTLFPSESFQRMPNVTNLEEGDKVSLEQFLRGL